MKILHILHRMEMGGIQRWAANLAHAKRADGVTMDVMFMKTPISQELVKEIEAGGCRVIGPAPSVFNLVKLFMFLRDLQRKYGPYDVVHGHLYYNAGIVLGMFRVLGVPVRLHHIHSIMSRVDLKLTWRQWRWWIMRPIQWMILWGATHRVAISKTTGLSMFGAEWGKRKGDEVVPAGIPVPEIVSIQELAALRTELGLPKGVKILGHIGRLVIIKNQHKIIEILGVLKSQGENVWLLMVGDGPLRGELEALAHEKGVADRIIWGGMRADATRYLQLFDVMLWPSFSESFGLVALEAQALGVPVVASNGVPQEVFAARSGWFKRVNLSLPLDDWVQAVKESFTRKVEPVKANKAFSESSLEINHNMANLLELYCRK